MTPLPLHLILLLSFSALGPRPEKLLEPPRAERPEKLLEPPRAERAAASWAPALSVPGSLPSPPARRGEGCLLPRAESGAASVRLRAAEPPRRRAGAQGRVRGQPRAAPLLSGSCGGGGPLLRAAVSGAQRAPAAGRLACAASQQRRSRDLRPDRQARSRALFLARLAAHRHSGLWGVSLFEGRSWVCAAPSEEPSAWRAGQWASPWRRHGPRGTT